MDENRALVLCLRECLLETRDPAVSTISSRRRSARPTCRLDYRRAATGSSGSSPYPRPSATSTRRVSHSPLFAAIAASLVRS